MRVHGRAVLFCRSPVGEVRELVLTSLLFSYYAASAPTLECAPSKSTNCASTLRNPASYGACEPIAWRSNSSVYEHVEARSSAYYGWATLLCSHEETSTWNAPSTRWKNTVQSVLLALSKNCWDRRRNHDIRIRSVWI